jgi:hypothetical protein
MKARSELESLLAEESHAAQARASRLFDETAGRRDIILFGAGGLGRKIARSLAQLGQPVIAFADSNPQLAGNHVEGVPVLLTEDAVARFGASAVFVVTVWRSPASERMTDRISFLRALGAAQVTTFAALAWKYPRELLPYYSIAPPEHVLDAREQVVRAFELLADEPSRELFVAHLRLRLNLDWAGLPGAASEPEYFAPDLFCLSPEERFVDCGAFDGDTARSFLRLVPDFRGRIDAFEGCSSLADHAACLILCA